MPETYNPIQDSQKWINQVGYEGNFSPVDNSLLLRHILLGSGLGLTAGAVRGENMWTPAWRAGLGAGVGSMLGTQFSNPNNQVSNSALGALLGGGAGLASTYLHKPKKESGKLQLPGLTLKAKTASLNNILDKIREQIPVARLPDIAAGATVGGGSGWLYDKLRKDPSLTPHEQKQQKWKRIISGAGLGALGSNLVGDRARRYISNTIIPFDYKDQSNAPVKPTTGGAVTASPNLVTSTGLMKPTLKKVWEAGILDRPQQPGVADYLHGKYEEPFKYRPELRDQTRANTTARRELIRLGMGIKPPEAESIWKQQPDSTYSLNPQHKNVNNLLEEFMYPAPQNTPEFTQNPQGAIANLNKAPDWNSGLMTPISGGQRIPLFPYEGKHGTDYLARFLKKWNVEVRDYEKEKAIKYLKDKYLNHVVDPKLSLNDYQDGQKPNDQLATLGKRYALEHLIMKRSPWVSQRMYFNQLPDKGKDGATNQYATIPSTAAGELYPGNSIGVYDEADQDTRLTNLQELRQLDRAIK